MTITQELANWLQNEAYGTIGEDIFVENLPAEVDYAITVSRGIAGRQDTYVPILRQVIDVYARDYSSLDVEALLTDIFNKLHARNEYTLTTGGVSVMQSEVQQPQFMGKDESSRFMYKTQILFFTRNPDNTNH